MKTGQCPRCRSTSVYWHQDGLITTSSLVGLEVNRQSRAPLDTYVCAECGYLENYLATDALQEVKRKWKKVSQS